MADITATTTTAKPKRSASRKTESSVVGKELLVNVAPSKKWLPEPGFPEFIVVRLPFAKKAHKDKKLLKRFIQALKTAIQANFPDEKKQVKATRTQGSI